MTKELFVKAINTLKKQRDVDYMFSKSMNECFPEAFQASLLPPTALLEDMIILLLEDCVGDTVYDEFGYSWISWFIYEKEFGKSDLIVSQNGKEIPLNSAEELYDFLVKRK